MSQRHLGVTPPRAIPPTLSRGVVIPPALPPQSPLHRPRVSSPLCQSMDCHCLPKVPTQFPNARDISLYIWVTLANSSFKDIKDAQLRTSPL